MKRLTRSLLAKSEEAFALALEIYNKPTIHNRVEAFCFLYTNAWELLLKGRLLETTKTETSIFYRKRRGQPRRSISLRDALRRLMQDPNDPVRKNIEEIADLRDQGTHLVIPELEAVYAGLFQAGALNYVDYLGRWFARKPSMFMSPPLLSLVWDLAHLEPKVLRKKYGKEALAFLQNQRTRIETEEAQFSDRRFSISINYKLVLTRRPQNADIALGAGPGGAIAGQIIEVPRDLETTHPFTQKSAVQTIRNRLGKQIRFTNYNFQAVLHKEGVKKADSSPFHYRFKQTGTHCYSEQLIEMILSKIKADGGYLERARQSYRRRLARK